MNMSISYKFVDAKSLHKPGYVKIIKCDNSLYDCICKVYPKVLSDIIFEYSHDIIIISVYEYSRGMRKIQIDTENVLWIKMHDYYRCRHSFFSPGEKVHNMNTVFAFYNYYMKQRYDIDNYIQNINMNNYDIFKNVINDHNFIIVNEYDNKYKVDISNINHFEKCIHVTKLLIDTLTLK